MRFTECIVATCTFRCPSLFVRMCKVQVQRRPEAFDAIIPDPLGMLEGESIPSQGLLWIHLVAREVVGRDCRLKIVGVCFPRLPVRHRRLDEVTSAFGSNALGAQLHDGIVWVQEDIETRDSRERPKRTGQLEKVPPQAGRHEPRPDT